MIPHSYIVISLLVYIVSILSSLSKAIYHYFPILSYLTFDIGKKEIPILLLCSDGDAATTRPNVMPL